MKRIICLCLVIFAALTVFSACELLHKHEFGEWTVVKDATCTEAGIETRSCSCGEEDSQEIPPLGHDEEFIEGKAATCTEAGITDGKKCKACGEILEEQNELPAHGHTEVVYKAVDATCTEKGVTEGKICVVCDAVLVAQEEIAALGHDIITDETKAPTCTESGLTAGEHCSRCNYKVVQEEVAALGHDIVTDEAKAPTCTETGLTAGEHCSRCNYKVVQEEVAALGHDIVTDEAKAPTCTETGLTAGEHCSRCNYKVAQEVVPANGHTEVIDKAVAPDCENTGLTEGKHCSVCDEVLVAQETVDKLGHDIIVDEAKAPTCTESGLTKGEHCSRCDYKIAQEIVPANGHTDENPRDYICDICEADLCTDHSEEIIPAKAATCTESGLTEGKKCSICGEILVAQNVVEALGHTEVIDAAKAPDCVNTGLTEGKHCSVCNEVLVAQNVVAALGHTEVIDAAKAPDCVNTGLTEGKHCSVCNEVLVAQNVVAALGHKNSDTVEENRTEATCLKDGKYDSVIYCSVCNAELSRESITILAKGHDYENGSIASTYAGNCQSPSSVTKRCANCNRTQAFYGEINKEIHANIVTDAAKAPTCTESGLTEGSHCSACNEIIVAQETVDALGHTAGDKEYAKIEVDVCPCEAERIYFILCTVCGAEMGMGIDEAIGHSFTNYLPAEPENGRPICEFTPMEVAECDNCDCTDCNRTDVRITGDAPGHKVVIDDAKAPTCTESGLTKGEHCSVCNTVFVEQEIVPALGHSEVIDKAVVPGCESTGLTEGKHCSVCDVVLVTQEIVPALGHSYQSVVTDPTCNDPGLATYTCSACGNSYSEVIDALGHNFEITEKTEPTCSSAGYITYTCSGCGDGYTETNGEALGHTAGEPVIEGDVVEADCINNGQYYSAVYCSACGTQISGEIVVIPAKGHSYDNHVCSVCGIDDPDHYFVMTIPEALNAVDGRKVEVSGTVCTINTIWTDTNNNFSVTIVDGDGNQLYIYRLATKVALGDKITVQGVMATYNGNRQIGQGATATIDGHDTSYDYTEMTIDEALVAADNTNVIVSGIVVEIGIAYDSGYNNMSVYISTNGGARLYVYRLTGEVQLGDAITIKGSMGTYNGQRQITGGTFEKTGEHDCFDIAPASCQTGPYCRFCGKLHGEPYAHKDTYDANYLCDYDCGTVLPPCADSTLTIEKALYLGGLYSHNVFTEGKYYVTGKITSIVSTTYGNMYIEDENGNEIYIYGFYNADGSARFDAMENQPAVGDMVTVYAIIGNYNGAQIKNGWMTARYPAVNGSVGLNYSLNEDGQSYTVTGRGVCPDKDIVIPTEYMGLPVTHIGVDAFYNDEKITSVVISESITELGSYAFGGCGNLTSVTILSNSITTLPSRVFYYSVITSIELPESVKVIDNYAFQSCYYLETIYIPAGLESVGSEAFDGADAIHTIYYGGSEEDWAKISVVDYHNDVLKLATKVYNYGKASQGLAFNVGTDGTAQVDNMGTCTDTEVIVPDTTTDGYAVSGLESMAFYNKTEITSVILPEGLKVIGNDAFGLCSSLKSVSISSSVEEIGDGVFAECTSLTSIRLPSNLASLGKNVFYGCTSLTEIYYDGSISEWDLISKNELWDNGTADYTIYCTDGEISKDGTVSEY